MFLLLGQCASTLMRTEWAGQMKSPDYPSYRKGLDCQWIIKVSDGNIVQVTFTDLAVRFLHITRYLLFHAITSSFLNNGHVVFYFAFEGGIFWQYLPYWVFVKNVGNIILFN